MFNGILIKTFHFIWVSPRNWRREANGILTLVGTSDTASGDFRTEKSESCSLSVGAWAGPWHFSPQVCTWLAITADYNSGSYKGSGKGRFEEGSQYSIVEGVLGTS
ncbi:21081_t:CDS:2 [Rhizophagus irregularis]|nr:21081_t:CDS:2 [Rhizophagus irregularis]